MVELTKDEARSLVDLLESSLLDVIRNDTEIDSIGWLCNLMSIYKKCMAVESEGDTNG